jgi:hypothetical protein
MKNETRRNFEHARKLSGKILIQLQSEGYKYVQIKGYTMERHPEYVEPHYFMLIPMKTLPEDPQSKDIYEPIESEFLANWALQSNDDHTEILVSEPTRMAS